MLMSSRTVHKITIAMALVGGLNLMPTTRAAPSSTSGASPANTEHGSPEAIASPQTQRLKVHLSWGYRSQRVKPFHITFLTNEVALTEVKPVGFETGDTLQAGICDTQAGAGDVDGVEL